MLWLRALIFWFLFCITIICYGIVLFVCIPFTSKEGRYAIVKKWCRAVVGLMRTICGVRYEITGMDNVPASGPVILLSKHQSGWETPYAYIMYIDIGPITRYIVTLNWAFFAVLVAISSIMCLLGFRFGRDIEKEAERQQTFFQNASHELKTPLMAIQGYAEGIQAGVMDTGSAAEVILKESDRMTELVDELLDISKIDMGRQQLALSEMDVRELLYDSIRAVEPAAAGGIAIVPDFPEEPVMVSCDDTRLRRAVTNILSNGVRYARSELRLTCRTEKRHVTIRIQDDGDGIAEEDLPHIFDRFYMGRSGKSGIGLALTKEIVHLHRGTIRAYNGETGAVFEVTLPMDR